LISEFREKVPGITMRSTFIVGFPGERDEHVAYLEEWLGRAKLDRVGFFSYSQEDGTPGAELPEQVPEREKRRRLVRLRERARLASEAARSERIGDTVRVLVEERRSLRKSDPIAAALGSRDVFAGRSMGEAPGVDGAIFFEGAQAEPGEFVDVELQGHGAFDFYGRAVRSLEPMAVG